MNQTKNFLRAILLLWILPGAAPPLGSQNEGAEKIKQPVEARIEPKHRTDPSFVVGDVIVAHVQEPAPNLTTLRPDFSPELAALIQKMSFLRETPASRAGVELALLDAGARHAGVPLAGWLGAELRSVRVNALLVEQGFRVMELSPHRESLEEVFLRLTREAGRPRYQ